MKALLCSLVCASATVVASAQARWPSEGPPRPLPTHAVKFPPYDLRTLPNGLQVVAVLHHEQPIVSMRLLVRAGSALNPKGKLGVADLVASLLDQGTTTKSATELNDEIDFIGGQINAGTGTNLTFMGTVVMKDSYEHGLQILSDMARHPAFAPAEIERQRQQMLSSLRVSLENPEFIANAVFDRLVYGFHPYGMPETGTPQTIGSITRDDLVAFHQRNFVPNNALLAVVGDLTVDDAFNGVTKVFGDWERREVPAHTFVAPPDPARRIVVVNKPDAVQTEVRVGHLGVKRNMPDYMALNLALRILGGEGANRLHQLLRTERSLTYGAEANMDTLNEAGDFEATTNTRSAATAEVVRLIVDEFWRLQREPVRAEELADAKAYLTGSFPLTIETPDAIATQVLNVLFYGLPVDDLQSFRDRVNAITVDDIQRVARYYLRPDRVSIVLVGNAAAFAPQLRAAGFGNFETIDMGDLDLTAANFKRAGAASRAGGTDSAGGAPGASIVRPGGAFAYQSKSGAIVTDESLKARTLLDQVIAAKGGLDVLRGVKSITAVTHAEMNGPAGPVDVLTTTVLQYPNHVRVETRLPNDTIMQAYDGVHAWVKDSRGVHDVPERMARELDSSFRRDVLSVLIAARDGSVRTRLLPDVKDEAGQPHHALEFSSTDLEPTIFYVDPDTSLIARQTYVAGGAGQPLVEELFSDYKPVEGVQIAFTARVRQGGQPVLERHVTDIKINAPVDPVLFKRPAS